jgi:hypothetical protein
MFLFVASGGDGPRAGRFNESPAGPPKEALENVGLFGGHEFGVGG